MQHHLCNTHDRSVLSLHEPILLWVMRRYELSLNSFCTAKFLEFTRDEFTTIVTPKSLHMLPRLFLHQCLKLTELRECLALLLREEDPALPRKIIKKYQIVPVLLCRSY